MQGDKEGDEKISIFEVMSKKPLGHKAYGSIPHLPGSRLGPGDHHISNGQAVIATEKVRDKNDLVIVQEKLDGSNCCVAKVDGQVLALGRAGYLANTSQYPIHTVFAGWVEDNKERFYSLLREGERVCGEFLAQAVGTRYNLSHEPFVPFDILIGKIRTPYFVFENRVKEYGFTIPNLLHIGGSYSIENAIKSISISGHGAIDDVEGAIWRVERNGEVDFLAKFVHHYKQDGKYFPEVTGLDTVWNLDVSRWL